MHTQHTNPSSAAAADLSSELLKQSGSLRRAVESPYLVPFDGSFKLADADTAPPKNGPNRDECKKKLARLVEHLAELQEKLYADDRHGALLIFQAMDAAGKDGTIKALLTGVNPAGCHVVSFKQPSAEDLDHDYLWRTARNLPEQGRIGVFNRSYYEEALIVRVHPAILAAQRLPELQDDQQLWAQRFVSFREHERHLAANGYLVLKFFLNVSKEEQTERFRRRLAEPEKLWKFSEGDLREQEHWDEYMHAYEEVLRNTSTPWAPWYAIPADDKAFMRMTVADIVVRAMENLEIDFPEVCPKRKKELAAIHKMLKQRGKKRS